MKKANILLIVVIVFELVLLVVMGFNQKDTTTETHEIDDVVGVVKKFEFEGHTYITRGYKTGGICHDENCKCKIDSIKY